jgi:plastocyanin
MLLAAAGCRPEGGEPAPVLELAGDTIRLERGVRLHEFRLLTTGIEPQRAEARRGDVVRFTAADVQGHAIRFDAQALSAEARAFLDDTDQLSGPPLLGSGAAWVITLEGAPPGEYPFLCISHETRAVLIVE